jgi:hypothetical protein
MFLFAPVHPWMQMTARVVPSRGTTEHEHEPRGARELPPFGHCEQIFLKVF